MTLRYPPTKIEVFRPSIGEEEIDAVADVMRSGWIGRGPKVEEFESEWARHIGVDKANVVSVGCATEGLYQIMQWLRYEDAGSEIIIPDNAFIGTASAILENGLTIKLCDIDRQTLTVALNPSGNAWKSATAGMVFQNYGGFDSGRNGIEAACFRMSIPMIEDMACHPMGRPIGDFAVYSFDAMKVLTCGDGGMVYCRDVGAVEAIRQATRLGMTTESGKSNSSDRWWEFRAVTPGRRSMMNDIGAAIGLVQLKRLPEMVARRESIWNQYKVLLSSEWFEDMEWLQTPLQPSDGQPASYYTYWIALPGDGVRDRLAHYLRERGIYTTYRYFSVSKAYNWDVNTPNSHWASDHVLNLPLHPGLSDDDVSLICETIAEFGRIL